MHKTYQQVLSLMLQYAWVISAQTRHEYSNSAAGFGTVLCVRQRVLCSFGKTAVQSVSQSVRGPIELGKPGSPLLLLLTGLVCKLRADWGSMQVL
jgi:hypothetical protein